MICRSFEIKVTRDRLRRRCFKCNRLVRRDTNKIMERSAASDPGCDAPCECDGKSIRGKGAFIHPVTAQGDIPAGLERVAAMNDEPCIGFQGKARARHRIKKVSVPVMRCGKVGTSGHGRRQIIADDQTVLI